MQRCQKCEQLKPESRFRTVTAKGKRYPRKTCRECDGLVQATRFQRPRPGGRSRLPTRAELAAWHATGCRL